jgi:hypothetical protein
MGTAAGIYLFYLGFSMLQRKRLIMNTPSSKIRSASMGLVEVSGLAVGPYTMTAPLCRLPCFYCRTMAWEWKQSGKNKQWVKIIDEALHVPFYLDDNTGRVLVDPQGAELDIHRDFHEEYTPSFFSSHDFIPANVSSYLASRGFADREKIKVEEYCIKPKNALFVLGTLAENPGLEVGPNPVRNVAPIGSATRFNVSTFMVNPVRSMLDSIPGISQTATTRSTRSITVVNRDDPPSAHNPEVIHLSTESSKPASTADMSQQEKIAAALAKAGITNPAAWAVAGLGTPEAAAVMTAKERLQEFDLRPKSVLKKGSHNPAFFISWRSQKDVVRSLGWKSALLIWGGPALTLLSAYALAAHLNLL